MAGDQSIRTFRIHIFDPSDDEWYDSDISAGTGDGTADWITGTERADQTAPLSLFTLQRLFIPPGPPPLVKWNPGGRQDITVVRYFLAANGIVVSADRIVTGHRVAYTGNIETGPGRAGRIEQIIIEGTLSEVPVDEIQDGARPQSGDA
jgi:hypothetical protein